MVFIVDLDSLFSGIGFSVLLYRVTSFDFKPRISASNLKSSTRSECQKYVEFTISLRTCQRYHFDKHKKIIHKNIEMMLSIMMRIN
jgi:hypothetical protein